MTAVPGTDVNTAPLAELDPEVAQAMAGELARQRDTLEMIASENFSPRSVLQLQGGRGPEGRSEATWDRI